MKGLMQVLRCLKEQRQQIKSRLYGQRALHSTVNRAGRRSPWIQQMSWEISAFRPSILVRLGPSLSQWCIFIGPSALWSEI